MNTATKKSDEVPMLQFSDQKNFISEFLYALSRTLTKPFDCNFFFLVQHTLHGYIICKLKRQCATDFILVLCKRYFLLPYKPSQSHLLQAYWLQKNYLLQSQYPQSLQMEALGFHHLESLSSEHCCFDVGLTETSFSIVC